MTPNTRKFICDRAILFFCIRLTTVYHIDEVYFETFVEQEEQQQPKTVEQIALAYLDAKIKDTQ